MDGTKFDQLIKRLGTTRLTRLTALRGLAVGALAATIGLAAPDDAEARKKCGQCRKKKRKKTKSGKVRIRCKPKANGTLCSLAGATSATCQNGTCVASTTPIPPRPIPPAPPGFDCRVSGCTGQFAGLVCDPNSGQCVFCTDFRQCPGGQFCADGFCQGFEACVNDAQCAGIAPAGIEPLECNLNDNVNSEAPEDVCVIDRCDANFDCAQCRDAEDCEDQNLSDEFVCITNACVFPCTDQDDCDDQFGTNEFACIAGLCLRLD